MREQNLRGAENRGRPHEGEAQRERCAYLFKVVYDGEHRAAVVAASSAVKGSSRRMTAASCKSRRAN